MKYYLEDEYSDAPCTCSAEQPVREESPKKQRIVRPGATAAIPTKTTPKPYCALLNRKAKRPTTTIVREPVLIIDKRKRDKSQQTSFDSVIDTESFPQVPIIPFPPPMISRPTGTTEILAGQFPCPCLSSDVRPFLTGDGFQAQCHMPIRQAQAGDQKKFASYPPYQYRTQYTPMYDESPERLLKEDIYESQYKPQDRQPYDVAAASRESKPVKRRSWIKTFNDAFKSMTQRKPSDEPGLCRCGENLDICGPNVKPCGGAKGYATPCGYECNCSSYRECLKPYMYALCPCEKPCKCPRELRVQPQDQQIQEYPMSPQHALQTIPEYRPRHGSGASERSDRSRRVQAHRDHAGSEVRPYYHSDTVDADKPTLHANNPMEEECFCRDERPCTMMEESTKISHKKRKSASESEDCCCSCDEELCDCCCCCCLDVSKKGIQTSQFCLRESCTQTDRAPKRCCRCCRCCAMGGKKDCYKCLRGIHDMKPDVGENGCETLCEGGSNRPHGHHHSDRTSGVYTTHQNIHTHTAATNQAGAPRVHHHTKRTSTESRKSTRSAPVRGKTLMVRTNSIQCCMPTLENKSTSYDCDDTISTTRIDRFLSQLHGTNYEGHSLTGNYLQPLELTAEDITKLTQAKLRNYFLEGDTYLSPVSGRNYDLSYRGMSITSNITSTKLLKPLDINEQLKHATIATECFASKVEHTKLMTAICEAILSSNQTVPNYATLEEPTKEVRQGPVSKSSDATLPSSLSSAPPQFEILHTITEDNESANSVKIIDNISNSPIESQSLNQKLILEMQQNFKEEIDRLEEKVEKLLHDASNTVEVKPKAKVRSRSQSPCHLQMSSKQNKPKKEYKPLITKTGLFAVLPTRSQVLSDNSPRLSEPVAVSANQHDDVKLKRAPKADEESIIKYDTLVADNQKHVDKLLGQLEVLHNHSASTDKSKGVTYFKKDTYAKKDTCCLKPAGDVPYNPNLGTGENIAVPKILNSETSSNKLFHQLENLFIGDTHDNQVFYMNTICCDDPGPSTSTSVKDANVTSKTYDQINQRPLVDFSSIIFHKLPKAENTKSQNVKKGESIASVSSPNFILNNLQSFTTDISDSYTVQKMLRNGETTFHSTSSSLFRGNNSSDSSNFDDQNDKQRK
ncbi:hypothetical protein Trydic_g22202 [Trypoxylus dichotomus]